MGAGFETYFWDDATGPQRPVSGVFSREDLQKLMNRRTQRLKLEAVAIDDKITDRYYQKEAIRAVCQQLEQGFRKHLLVMATGTGKTRTASSLTDVLSRGNYVTNILFLADRTALVKQAKDDFKNYLPHMSLCNLCSNKDDRQARIVFSTYPTMLNAIDEARTRDGRRLFTPAHFDLIIIDESHRSIFKKYRAIFQYFDAILVGLTATPKTDVDRNTYDFFEMEHRVPTYAYDYETAVYQDHVLVPYYNYEVTTKFLEEGIVYDDLSPEDQERYEEDFDEDGDVPDFIPSAALNEFVFNEITVDTVLQDLMERGIHVAGGDRLGKTIIFAQNKRHAEFIVQRFNQLYPQYNGTFAQRVVCDDSYAQTVIDDFKIPDKAPHIAVSVDMMDTGIDVPQCVNLVFFKKVRSKAKFWQMIGRGTRLCKGLTCTDQVDGEYTDKRRFLIFDYCGNFEYFRQHKEGYEARETKSLSENIFGKQIRLIMALQGSDFTGEEYQAWRENLVSTCHGQVVALKDELIAVKLHRQYVDKYRNRDVFTCLSDEAKGELEREIAPLVYNPDTDELAKRFDGEVTYMGRFVFPSASGAAVYYVRFENKREYDDLGYSRLLAYVLKEGGGYPYSYAKYVGGVLVASGGDYNYHRTTSRFGVYNHVQVVNREGYSHMIVPVGNDGTFIISLGNDVFRQYYLNIFYALFICMVLISYGMFFRFASPKEYRLKGSLQARIRNNVIYLIVGLAVLMTVLSVLFNTLSFEQRHRSRMIDLSRYVVSELEDFNTMDSNEDRRINQVLSNMYDISGVDVNIYDWQGRLVSTSRAFIFENGLDGFLLNPKAYQQIVREGNLRLVQYEEIGEIHYRSVYVPLELTNGKRYVVNIPYFTQSGELNMDILLIIVISVNIAVVVVVLAFALASIVAGRVTKPLQLVNDRLSQMKLGEKNEKISYDSQDEVGEVIKAYNNMVDKLSDSMKKLARSEREGAWMGMARQIAHEIKNPLTPMKLNLQFLQRAMRNDNPEELRRRVMNVSAVLIEQIDYMTSIASAFSDFSRLQVMNRELFNLSEQVDNCVRLFAENVDSLQSDVVPGVFVYGDKEQMNRVIVNVLKNAVQSIPEEKEGRVGVRLYTEEGHVVLSIKDNGSGIPENIRDHVMEPNFTTKTKGTGLGLAMSYKIIENMGGTITFESKEGVGTIFYITLKYSEKD